MHWWQFELFRKRDGYINCKEIINEINDNIIPKNQIAHQMEKHNQKSALRWLLEVHPKRYQYGTDEQVNLVRHFLHNGYNLNLKENDRLPNYVPVRIKALLVIHGDLPQESLDNHKIGSTVQDLLRDDFKKSIQEKNTKIYLKLLRFSHKNQETIWKKYDFNMHLKELVQKRQENLFETFIIFLIQEKDPMRNKIRLMLNELKIADNNDELYDLFIEKYNDIVKVYTFHDMFDMTGSWSNQSAKTVRKSTMNNLNEEKKAEFNVPSDDHSIAARDSKGLTNMEKIHNVNSTTDTNTAKANIPQNFHGNMHQRSFTTRLRVQDLAGNKSTGVIKNNAHSLAHTTAAPSKMGTTFPSDSPITTPAVLPSLMQGDVTTARLGGKLLPGRKYVPFFRGIHFFNNRPRFEISFPHTLESPALSYLKETGISEEQAFETINTLMQELAVHDQANLNAMHYNSWKDWAHQVYSNAYDSYQELIENTQQFKNKDIKKHPFVSFGQELIHPLRYAYAKKISGKRHDIALYPDYDKNGKPKYAEVGYVYVALIPQEELSQLSFVNVSQFITQNKFDINPRIMPEREMSFVGRVDEKYLIIRFLITWPDFSLSCEDLQKEFGFTVQEYNIYKNQVQNNSIDSLLERLINLQKERFDNLLIKQCDENNIILCYQGLWKNKFVLKLPTLNSIRIVKLFKKTEVEITKFIDKSFLDGCKESIENNTWIRQLFILMENENDVLHALRGADNLFKKFKAFYKNNKEQILSTLMGLNIGFPPALQSYLLLHPEDFIEGISKLNSQDKKEIEEILAESLENKNKYSISPEILDAYKGHKIADKKNEPKNQMTQKKDNIPVPHSRDMKPITSHERTKNESDCLIKYLFLAIENRLYEKVTYYKDYQEKGILYNGKTALHLAIEKRDIEAINILTNGKGYEVVKIYATAGEGSGMNCLQFAAVTANSKIVGYMLRQNSYLDRRTNSDCINGFKNLTALQIACIQGDIESVKLLLKFNSNSLQETDDKKSLINLAEKHQELVKYLKKIDKFKTAVNEYFYQSNELYHDQIHKIIRERLNNDMKLTNNQFSIIKNKILGLKLMKHLKEYAGKIKASLEEYRQEYSKEGIDSEVINQLILTLCPNGVDYNLITLLCRDGQGELLLYFIQTFNTPLNSVPARSQTVILDPPLVVAAKFCQYNLLEMIWEVQRNFFSIYNPKKENKETVGTTAANYQSIINSISVKDRRGYHLPEPRLLQKFIDFDNRNLNKTDVILEKQSESTGEDMPIATEIDHSYANTQPLHELYGLKESVHRTVSNQVLGGLAYQEIPGDGHCLFRAIGKSLDLDAQDLRRIVAEYLEENITHFKPYYAEQNRDFSKHIADIRNGTEWGTHIEIEVIQRITDRPIIIIRSDANPTMPDNLAQYQGAPIFVYYNGHTHYDVFTIQEGNDARTILAAIQTQIQQGNCVTYNPDLTQLDKHSRLKAYEITDQIENHNNCDRAADKVTQSHKKLKINTSSSPTGSPMLTSFNLNNVNKASNVTLPHKIVNNRVSNQDHTAKPTQ